MTETIIGLALQLSYLYTHITISNIIDVSLVALVFFVAFQALYQTRALQMLRGIIITAIVGGGLLVLLPLNTLNWLIRFTLIAGAIALPILFQDELRRAFIGLGQFGGRRGEISDFDRFKQSLIQATNELSSRHFGALIVLEGKTLIEDVINTGIRLQAEVITPELLQTIFLPKTPLHDGAVVLRGDRLMAASCILPVQMEDLGNSQLGTRHRAALGLSVKVADALVIIISEETGWVSAAFAGRLYLDLSPGELEDWLNRFGEQLEDTRKFRWGWLRGGGLRPTLTNLVTAIALAVIAWLIVIYQTNPPGITTLQGVTLNVNGPPNSLLVMSNIPNTVTVQVQTTSDRIRGLSNSSVQALLNLNNLPPGVHSVPVRVATGDPFVQVISAQPSTVDVTLEQELSKPITPTVQIIDLPNLPPGYVVGNPSMNPGNVTITGPASKVTKVASARIDITLGDRRADFQEPGTPILLDSYGSPIKGLSVTPEQVVVTVPISRTFFTRQIGIQPDVDKRGLDPDYEVSAIQVNPSTVTLTGSQSALESVGPFLSTAPISLTNQTMDFTTDAPLIVPNGITVLNDKGNSIQSVEVTIKIQPVNGYLVVEKAVQVTNPPITSTITVSPERISVLLIGPQFLLKEVSADQALVIATVTLKETAPGIYSLPVEIKTPPDLEVQLFPNEVQVTVK